MGYRASRRTAIRSKKRIRNAVLFGVCFLIAALCVFSAFVPVESWKYRVRLPKIEPRAAEELRVHYLDVGNGACTVVELPDGKTVVVGGGENDGRARKNVLRFLNALKVDTVDALIVPDTAHSGVGALREIVRYFEVGEVYLPMVEEKNATYSAFLADVSQRKIPTCDASFGRLFEGEYTFTILYPLQNASSFEGTAILLSYAGYTILLGEKCGTELCEALITEKQTGLLGRWGVELTKIDAVCFHEDIGTESLSRFLLEFVPTSVLFSCQGGRSYQPSKECSELLDSTGLDVYRTDVNGRISLSVTPQAYSVTTEK